jgi:hypothetical protein
MGMGTATTAARDSPTTLRNRKNRSKEHEEDEEQAYPMGDLRNDAICVPSDGVSIAQTFLSQQVTFAGATCCASLSAWL